MFRSFWLFAAILTVVLGPAQAQQYPTVRCASSSAMRRAAGRTSRRARLRSSSAPTSANPSSWKTSLGANGTIAARSSCRQARRLHAAVLVERIAPTPYIYKNLGYDIFTDLKPIATIGQLDGLFMLVDAKSPYKTLQEFIAAAKKERLLYGSPGVGNGLHLATELFSKAAGIKMQHIPYKGASEVMNAMLSGSVNVMFVTPPSVMGLIKNGRVRALAFTGTKPFPAFPDVPLMTSVLPNFKPIGSWGMFFAPAKTPDAIVEKLNAAIHAALLNPKVASIMQRDGYFPDKRNVAETAAFFRKEVEETADAVKAAGIQPQ